MNNKELVSAVVNLLLATGNPEGRESIVSETTGYEKYLGKKVFIRTVTHHYTGEVTEVNSLSMTLRKAAWIADDGRLSEFVKDPNKANEVEPFNNPVTVNLYSVCDITEIPYLLEHVK